MRITNLYNPVYTQLCFHLKQTNKEDCQLFITTLPSNLSISKLIETLKTVTELDIGKIRLKQCTSMNIVMYACYFKNESSGLGKSVAPYYTEPAGNLRTEYIDDQKELISNFIEIEVKDDFKDQDNNFLVDKFNDIINKYIYKPIIDDYFKGETTHADTFKTNYHLNAERYPNHCIDRKYIHNVILDDEEIWTSEENFSLGNFKTTSEVTGNSSGYLNYLTASQISQLLYLYHFYKTEISNRLFARNKEIENPLLTFWLKSRTEAVLRYDEEKRSETITWVTTLTPSFRFKSVDEGVEFLEIVSEEEKVFHEMYVEALKSKFKTVLQQKHYFILKNALTLLDIHEEALRLTYFGNNIVDRIEEEYKNAKSN